MTTITLPPLPNTASEEPFTNDQLIAIISSYKSDFFSELYVKAEEELLRRLKLTTPNENH